MRSGRLVRRLKIDFYALFKQAGIEPCRCKLAKPLVAGGDWCLMLFHPEDNHSEFIVVEPPAMQAGETEIRIVDGHWAYFA